MTDRRTDILRGTLAFAEQEYACAEMIEDTDRMHREREYWAACVAAIRAEIACRDERKEQA
jgi:hypothetical protein